MYAWLKEYFNIIKYYIINGDFHDTQKYLSTIPVGLTLNSYYNQVQSHWSSREEETPEYNSDAYLCNNLLRLK